MSSKWTWTLLASLLLSNVYWFQLYYGSQKQYKNAVLYATSCAVVALAEARDAKPRRQQTVTVEAAIIEAMERYDMRDMKTAGVLFEMDRCKLLNHESLEPHVAKYVQAMENRWRGKSLGFPDCW